jgi:inactivated superfamily I helicase
MQLYFCHGYAAMPLRFHLSLSLSLTRLLLYNSRSNNHQRWTSHLSWKMITLSKKKILYVTMENEWVSEWVREKWGQSRQNLTRYIINTHKNFSFRQQLEFWHLWSPNQLKSIAMMIINRWRWEKDERKWQIFTYRQFTRIFWNRIFSLNQ